VNAAPEAYHCCTDLECIKPPKTIYPGGVENGGIDHYIFDGGGVGQFFTEIFFCD